MITTKKTTEMHLVRFNNHRPIIYWSQVLFHLDKQKRLYFLIMPMHTLLMVQI